MDCVAGTQISIETVSTYIDKPLPDKAKPFERRGQKAADLQNKMAGLPKGQNLGARSFVYQVRYLFVSFSYTYSGYKFPSDSRQHYITDADPTSAQFLQKHT
jgi:hypothetical protein